MFIDKGVFLLMYWYIDRLIKKVVLYRLLFYCKHKYKKTIFVLFLDDYISK